MLRNTSDGNAYCNKQCYDLKFTKKVQNIVQYMNNHELYKSHTNNTYLSHSQMELRLEVCKKKVDAHRLKVHTTSKTILRLNKTLQLHQRFLLLIQENKVHHLHELVCVALRNKCSIGYIIQKVIDAVKGMYNPHYSKDDKELSFIILQFGGPALLEIVHRTIKLPSCSTAYNMIKGKRNINTSVNATVLELAENIHVSEKAPKYGHMIKIDEHYVDKRA